MRVINTRSPSKSKDHPATQHFLNDGYKVFGWWCDDFEIRLRKCAKCGIQFKTIEVIIDDLREAFGDIKDNRSLGRPWNSGNDLLPQVENADKPRLDDNWRIQSNLCGR
jgi:hypothetical protein